MVTLINFRIKRTFKTFLEIQHSKQSQLQKEIFLIPYEDSNRITLQNNLSYQKCAEEV